MANIFKKIIDGLTPPKDPKNDGGKREKTPIPHNGPMTVQYLKDEIVRQFKDVMNDLTSWEGKSCMILYPMSFNIIMNPDDYKNIGETVPYVLPMALLGFYNAIRAKVEEAEKMGGSCSYIPPAKNWFFQWADSQKKEGSDGQELRRGEIVINSSLTRIEVTKDNIETIKNAGGTVSIVNSNTDYRNINPDALGGTTIGLSKTSEWDFDMKLPTDINAIRNTSRDTLNSYATLSYVDGREIKRFSMVDVQISISGSADTRRLSSRFIVNNDKIKNDMVRIQYLKEENIFQICAYGNVRVDECLLPMSESGINNWYRLSYNSKIFFVDANLQISFKAADSIINMVRQLHRTPYS